MNNEENQTAPAAGPEKPGRLKALATRQNLITAGLVVLALAAGITIGTVYSKQKDTASTGKAPFSSRADSSGNSQTSAAPDSSKQTDSSKAGTANGNSSALAPSGGGSTTTSNSVATTDVAITGNSFSPANITVKKGSRVTWTNKDNAIHALDRADGTDIGPHSQQLAKNESYTYSYSSLGTFKYLCIIHPGMTGTVTVID